MKYKFAPSSNYIRAHKTFIKRHPELRQKLKGQLELLQNNPHHSLLKIHELSGNLKGLQACSLTHKYRIVFKKEEDVIYLPNIGSHDEVY